MKYLGESEEFSRKKTKSGYKVFNFRLNEYELDTIAFLIDLHDSRRTMLSEKGREFQIRLRGLRRGIKEAKKALDEQDNKK